MSTLNPPLEPPPGDPEKLKRALAAAGIEVVPYEQYQHPDFRKALGFDTHPPSEPGQLAVAAIEQPSDKGKRHGEFTAAVLNAVTDGLSGTNTDVILAGTWPSIADYTTPEDMEKKRKILQQVDVASISTDTSCSNIYTNPAHRQIEKDTWQSIQTPFMVSAGNDGWQMAAGGKYENHRILPQFISGVIQYAPHSMTVGAAERDKDGECRIASYSSPVGPAFVTVVQDEAVNGHQPGKYRYYDSDRIETDIDPLARENLDKAIQNGADPFTKHHKAILLGKTKPPLDELPFLFRRAAEQVQDLQPEGKKEPLLTIYARHRDALIHHLIGEKKLEAYLTDEIKYGMLANEPNLPNGIPSQERLEQAVQAAIDKGSLKGVPLDPWSRAKLEKIIPVYVKSFITEPGKIPGSPADDLFTHYLDKEKELIQKRIRDDMDAEGYTNNLAGTSSASPIGAGMEAALQQRYPGAAHEDIMWAMAATAKPVYRVEGKPDMVLPYSENAAGLRYNDTHAGFGLPDFASADTLLSQNSFPPAQRKKITADMNPPQDRLYNIPVNEPINTTKATLELKFAGKSGEGEITLISPQGDEVLLSYRSQNHYAVASTNVFLNTQGKGDWQVRVPEGESLKDAQLTLHGLEPDVRMTRRPPEREPLRETPPLDRTPRTYKASDDKNKSIAQPHGGHRELSETMQENPLMDTAALTATNQHLPQKTPDQTQRR